MRNALIAEIASGVCIVEVKAHIQSFVHIHTKLGIDMILTKLLVATIVVVHSGIGRQRIHPKPQFGFFGHHAVGLGKEKVVILRTIDENTTQTGRIVTTRSVEFTIHTCVQGGVHIEVGQGIRLCRLNFAQSSVNGPGIDAFWYDFIFMCAVVVVSIRIAFASLGDVTVFVYLVIRSVRLGINVCQCQ